ncbi:MAG: sigma-70 family RNA polymerase sigma factor [Vulcanimicrobiota bacterium]
MFAMTQAILNSSVVGKPAAEKVEALPPQYAGDVDLQLMMRVKAGDEEAFNTLMRRNEKTVLNLIYRFTGDREIAPDLAQEVFMRIYRAAERFEPRAKFFTFLYRVTLNLCRNHRTKASRRQTTSLDAAGSGDNGPSFELVDPLGSAEEHVSRLELSMAVQEAVESLPEQQREAVSLQRFQGLAYEEIAEVLNLSIPAVKSRIHRAKLNLQERLRPYLERGEGAVSF